MGKFVNCFWRNTRTEKHRPDDPLNTDPPRTDPPARTDENLRCEFCECQISKSSGQYKRLSDTAKRYRAQEETIENKDKEIAKLQAELTETKRQLEAIRAQGSGSSSASGHRPGSRVA